MPGEFKSRKELEKHIWKKLLADIAKTTSPSEIEKLLKLFITEHERKQMIRRAAAVSMLDCKKSYRQIGEMLWLSSSTISAIRKSIRSADGYITRNTRWKVNGRRKKRFSTLPIKADNTRVILPHGKLALPQRWR